MIEIPGGTCRNTATLESSNFGFASGRIRKKIQLYGLHECIPTACKVNRIKPGRAETA